MSSGPVSTFLQQATNASTALGSINPDIYTYSNSTWQVLAASDKMASPSGWVLEASAQGQLVGSPRIQDLSRLVAGDMDLDWEDVSPFYRDHAGEQISYDLICLLNRLWVDVELALV